MEEVESRTSPRRFFEIWTLQIDYYRAFSLSLMSVIFAIFVDALFRPLIMWPMVKLAHAVRELWRGQRTLGWYTAPAEVGAVRAKERGRLWHVALGYYYSAEARLHTGVWSRTFVFERQVDKFALRYPKGSLITVRYCPGHAARSAVVESDQKRQIAEETSESVQRTVLR